MYCLDLDLDLTRRHTHRARGLLLVQVALETKRADLQGAVGVVAGREVEEVLQAVPLDLSAREDTGKRTESVGKSRGERSTIQG